MSENKSEKAPEKKETLEEQKAAADHQPKQLSEEQLKDISGGTKRAQAYLP